MTLLAKIEAFLERTGMSPTAFGIKALNDPPFVQQLRDGRDPKMSTAQKVEQFIADYRDEATLTIDTESDAGAYEKALLYPPFTQITDDTWTNGFVPGVTTQSERKPR